jgi:hypothetical protein
VHRVTIECAVYCCESYGEKSFHCYSFQWGEISRLKFEKCELLFAGVHSDVYCVGFDKRHLEK